MSDAQKIRHAQESDALSMLKIYSPSVLEGPTSFETELPSVEEFQSRIIETQKQFPWLVCEMNTEIVGYAYANIHRSRSAYDWSVESTVYVSDRHQSKGVGKALYQTLFKLLKGQGIVNIIAGITLPNPNSVRLHEKLGFVQIGQLKGIGFKFDQWWDVGWWQLQLQNPLRPKSLSPYSKEF